MLELAVAIVVAMLVIIIVALHNRTESRNHNCGRRKHNDREPDLDRCLNNKLSNANHRDGRRPAQP